MFTIVLFILWAVGVIDGDAFLILFLCHLGFN
ncbi:hypothetical protein OPIT5_29435 [Opitutaceae bacterium TAV5]|nr:hypothetical protein OPIT5_29435 [Opitutaceae bacterium TAV5]